MADPEHTCGVENGCKACASMTARWATRRRPPKQLRNLIEWARREWHNDGAEGETVHALCDALTLRLDKEQEQG